MLKWGMLTMSDLMKVAKELRGLSDEELREVLEFIAGLKRKRTEPKRGSVDAIMRAIGCWWMTPEETEQFLREVEEKRHMDNPKNDLPCKETFNVWAL